ncbi:segregation/condensation protein A [Leuconostocaceae bacterium ESL0958]|nr:segregation/condensation protein A [Leuconostocaceae bacterium ESL0958]
MSSPSLTIKITDFEGPLDLLLHLIKKHEMNIFDLPIAAVTAQYLDFLHEQQALRLDIAAEYLVMAASLIQIKSRDLLPKPAVSVDEGADEEDLDPKEALVNRLLNYQRFQEAAGFLAEQQAAGQQSFAKPADSSLAAANQPVAPLAPGLTLVDLQLAFESLLARKRDLAPQARQVQVAAFTIGDGLQAVRRQLDQLAAGQSLPFSQVFDGQWQREQLVMTFLAILELAKGHELTLWQAQEQGEILLKKRMADEGNQSN